MKPTPMPIAIVIGKDKKYLAWNSPITLVGAVTKKTNPTINAASTPATNP
jgi:hypothetical protein